MKRLAVIVAVAILLPFGSARGSGPDPTVVGRWTLLKYKAPVLAIHAALLRTGKVFFGAGSSNNPTNFNDGRFKAVLFNWRRGTFTRIDPPWDFFCSDHTFLPDGRLLIAGGTKQFDDFATTNNLEWQGSPKTYIFDPVTKTYERANDMAGGRWYPTLVSLGDGGVYASGGISATAGQDNVNAEVFKDGSWTTMTGTRQMPLYPHLTLLADGRLFYSGGNVFGNKGVGAGYLDVATSALTPYDGLGDDGLRNQSTTVLLPPAQSQRVMIAAGGAAPYAPAQVTNTAYIADLAGPDPTTYQQAASLTYPRMQLNSVILPNRTVFSSGGGTKPSERGTGVHQSEIYDPETDTWQTAARAHIERLYHSIALLLPDGRVLSAGGNPDTKLNPDGSVTRLNPFYEELRLEIYSPPYMFRRGRPRFDSAPTEIGYGDSIDVSLKDNNNIRDFSLVRPLAITHSMDANQRLVDVPIASRTGRHYTLTVPDKHNIAPPGWYMLFATDSRGVPSRARWVHLS